WKTAAFISSLLRYQSCHISLALSVEHQNRAGDLAGLHRAEGLVYVGQLSAPRDHIVQVEAALLVEIDIPQHVDAEAVGSHVGALDFALGEELRPVELDLLADRNHADDGRGAARLDAIEAFLGEFLESH